VLIENLHVTFQAPANSPAVTDVKTYLASEPVESAVTVTKELAEGIRDCVTDDGEPADAMSALRRRCTGQFRQDGRGLDVDRRLSCRAIVAMVEPVDVWRHNDSPAWHNWARDGRGPSPVPGAFVTACSR
jgi:hypothetical protein